ncbi:MAG: mechanosensitive ion channel family protein [Verrucomicrobiota bacterium]|nr:mechanosensitive ion channel family protein [Verrucomicrobiota bacterium]
MRKQILSLLGILLTLLPIPVIAQTSTGGDVHPHTIPQWIDHIGNTMVWQFTISELALSFCIILVTFLLRNILTRLVFARLKTLAERTKWEYDDQLIHSLEPPFTFFLVVLGMFLAIVALPLEDDLQSMVNLVFRGLSMASLFWAVSRALSVLLDAAADNAIKKGSGIGDFMPLIKKAVNVFVILVAAIMVIDNLGYSVSGIIATLGLGGAAFALAAKDTIANMYGAFAIATDRPFKVGDWIQVGDRVDGEVEEIGVRSTRVRTWPKALIIIPNNVLCNEYIVNWSRMPHRRIRQTLGVTYDTSPDQMRALLAEIRALIKNHPGIAEDGQHVRFVSFGSSSLDILVNYFTKTTVYAEHVAIQEGINLQMMEIVAKHGLSFAFPTQTVHFDGEIARSFADGVTAKQAKTPKLSD